MEKIVAPAHIRIIAFNPDPEGRGFCLDADTGPLGRPLERRALQVEVLWTNKGYEVAADGCFVDLDFEEEEEITRWK